MTRKTTTPSEQNNRPLPLGPGPGLVRPASIHCRLRPGPSTGAHSGRPLGLRYGRWNCTTWRASLTKDITSCCIQLHRAPRRATTYVHTCIGMQHGLCMGIRTQAYVRIMPDLQRPTSPILLLRHARPPPCALSCRRPHLITLPRGPACMSRYRSPHRTSARFSFMRLAIAQTDHVIDSYMCM